MKKLLAYFSITITASLLIFSCKSSSTEPVDISTGEGSTIISGQVLDNTTNEPIPGAEVNIYVPGEVIGKTTDENGRFGAEFNIAKSMDIMIITFLKGFYTDTSSVSVTAEKESSVIVKLQEKTTGVDVSGDPASIVLISTSAQSIGVKESGSLESAVVTFEVQDSAGNSINIDHSVWVHLKLGQAPGGGEYINPTAVKTNALGRVTVSISSGIKAGVIQFVAEINFNGKIIISKPVNIAIHGGHPDQNHLSVATEYSNIPGWHIDGFKNNITAIIGDKYANPVKPRTAAYFTTTGGIIEGSALTNELGQGTAILLSGNPRPYHPIYGAGFATIYTSTADENYNKITDSVVVLFSGAPILNVFPADFGNIEHLGSKTVRYTIMDINGNPIAPGNIVSVNVIEGSGISLGGDVNFTTMDTQSKEATQFSVRIIDSDREEPKGPRNISIQITVKGVSGYATASVYGTADF